MTNLNPIKKKIHKETLKVSVYYSSEILIEFFNGEFIQFIAGYIHES